MALRSLRRTPYVSAKNPPPQVTYQDAAALYASDIPLRSVMMYKASQVVTPERAGAKPFSTDIRVTTFEFFKAFDSPSYLVLDGRARTMTPRLPSSCFLNA